MKETILSVKNLHVNFHTYAGEVGADISEIIALEK